MKQMVQLNEILGNDKIVKILDYFFYNSVSDISQVDLINKVGLAKATAVKWLRKLVSLHFLTLKKIGVTNLYSLNDSNTIVKQLKVLKSLFLLNGLEIKNSELFLYGSCSRGDNDNFSDMDILVLGTMKKNDIFEIIEKYSKKIGKTINFVNFTDIEYSQLARKDAAFYDRIEKDKIRLK